MRYNVLTRSKILPRACNFMSLLMPRLDLFGWANSLSALLFVLLFYHCVKLVLSNYLKGR